MPRTQGSTVDSVWVEGGGVCVFFNKKKTPPKQPKLICSLFRIKNIVLGCLKKRPVCSDLEKQQQCCTLLSKRHGILTHYPNPKLTLTLTLEILTENFRCPKQKSPRDVW